MTVTKLDLMKGLDPLSAHIVASRRGKSGEIGKTRADFEELVRRLVGDSVQPEILSWDIIALDDDTGIKVTFKGRNLIPPGWARASLAATTGVPNDGITWTSRLPGESGNNITIQYTNTAGAASVVASGNAIVVDCETGVTDADAILVLVAAEPTVSRMVSAALTGALGTGKPVALPVTPLAGGTGARLLTAYLLMAQGTNKDLIFRARIPGAKGSSIAIAFVDHASYTVPSVSCSGSIITVTLKAGTTTASAVLTALRANASAMALIDVDLAPGSSGAGAPAAFAHTHLSRRTADWNAGWVPLAGNLPATVSATIGYDSITDDTAVVTFPIMVAPQVNTGACMVQLPTCDTVHHIYFPVVT